MTVISNRTFGGEIPRAPADKLPDGNAQLTSNCNFAYGELRSMKGLFQQTRLANAAKSVFSIDGLLFFSWPYRTKAWKGPVIGDTYNRMYFTGQDGGMRVARTTITRVDGGEPPTSYQVGVPSVANAPTFALINRTQIPEYPNAAVRLYSYYETDGRRYDEQQITTFTTVAAFREYTFQIAPPTVDLSGVGATALPVQQRTARLRGYWVEVIVENPSEGGGTITQRVYTDAGGNVYEVVDSRTLRFNNQTIANVVAFTPVDSGETTPGDWLSVRLTQVGASTPEAAQPTVRAEVYDPTTNTIVFTLSASSAVESQRSDAVPGGVEARLIKDGQNAGFWRLTLTYGAMDTRAYVVTIVNDFMEESKPSPPVLVSPNYMQFVRLTFTAPSATGYVPYSRYRLYRSIGTGDYLSVFESTQSFTQSTVVVDDTAISVRSTDATLSSIGWDEPPAGLRGLTLLPNGFFAGFVGDTLYFSEPYRPWAWPYSMTFPVGVVGMRAIENSLVVTTFSYPYVVSGVHPEAMTQSQLTTSQAGISDHGMAVVGNTVAYISNDGLAVVSGFNVDLSISQRLWTREVWKAKFGAVLNDLELAYHDGSLVCVSPTAGKMWDLRLDSEAGGNLTSLTLTAGASYVLPLSDQLYLIDGNYLYQYKGSATSLTYDWWSKDHILPRPTSFTAGFINCSGQVTVTVYADGVQAFQQTFLAPSYFRMATGRKALRWSYRLSGTGIVKELTIAERRRELRRV